MTPSPAGAGPQLFSQCSIPGRRLNVTRAETFAFSLLGQALILAMFTYVTCCLVGSPPVITRPTTFSDAVWLFRGHSGGGGGNHEKFPASHGNYPRASLAEQLATPTVMLPKEPSKLMLESTVVAVPDITIPQGGQTGDPMSSLTQMLSNGPGERGIGNGCCGGDGDSFGPHSGSGPPGIFSPGRNGVTVPQVIYNPEPAFSDQARKAKQQGLVMLMLVVGKDGRPYNIRVAQSLGMGLDEKAMEAVTRWRFEPATFNGQPVATQIAVEVNFHLY